MNPILQQLKDQIAANTQVEASAALLINGIAGRIQSAVDAAIENGASAEDLAPVTEEIAALQQSATALSSAVTANTPAAPAPAPSDTPPADAPPA